MTYITEVKNIINLLNNCFQCLWICWCVPAYAQPKMSWEALGGEYKLRFDSEELNVRAKIKGQNLNLFKKVVK